MQQKDNMQSVMPDGKQRNGKRVSVPQNPTEGNSSQEAISQPEVGVKEIPRPSGTKPAKREFQVEQGKMESEQRQETVQEEKDPTEKSGGDPVTPQSEGGTNAPPERPHAEQKKGPVGELKWHKKDVVASGEEHRPLFKGEPAQEKPPLRAEDSAVPDTTPALPEKEEKTSRRKLWMLVMLGLPLGAVIALIIGVVVGYSVLGDEPVGDVFTRDLWEHLYNLIYG